ncbi:MAG: HD domain-containing protein, partial [Candidatus Dojkabacteria bacterium]
MTIQQAYVKFQIMPSLQLHQLRVGAVAKLILEHSPGKLERGEIITACLLHDMGNIIKFDLDLLPQFLLPEGKAYWQGVKTDFIKKYGSDEHEATVKIAKELDVSDKTLVLMSNIGFSKAP